MSNWHLANLRPVRALPNVPGRYPSLIWSVREERKLIGIEHVVCRAFVEDQISRRKPSTRIARFDFE